MKKVLFIAYYFPPAGGSAVQRILKFVKYLPRHGWMPVILTAREKDYALTDHSLTAEVPHGVRVVRTAAPDLYRWYGRMRGERSETSPDLAAIADREGRSWKGRLALAVRSAFFIPDARAGWIPFAFRRAGKLIQEEGVRLVFVSGPPFSGTLAAGLAAARYGLPWVSDYRDPWTQAYFYFKRPSWSRRWEETLESQLIRRASALTAINEKIITGLREKYGFPEPGRAHIIHNGYDPEDFENLHPVKEKRFTIVYTGTLNTRMNPGMLLEAVRRLAGEMPDLKDRCRIKFIGRIGGDVMPMLQDPFFKGMIELHVHMAHRECLGHAQGAHLLLLIIPRSSGNELIMTGKLFEYLRTGNPILCLSDSGDAADVIRRSGSGFVLTDGDIEGTVRILRESYRRWKQGRRILDTNPDPGLLERFDRRRSARILACLFDEILKKHR
ncbi:MAG TPA: hypothetical protein ENN03_03675 [bacterium]|nr:hypothetical protein [bacterium]